MGSIVPMHPGATDIPVGPSVPVSHRALEIGKAAEHLVCADLILQGYRCFLTDQGLPYDVVVDVEGVLIRVQVKATVGPRNVMSSARKERRRYSFNIRSRGKGGSRRLSNDECDLAALVALDLKLIAYMRIEDVKQTVNLCNPTGASFRMRTFYDFPFDAALKKTADGARYMERNLHKIDDERLSVASAARRYGVDPKLALNRIYKGWSFKDAVSTPPIAPWSRVNAQRAKIGSSI